MTTRWTFSDPRSNPVATWRMPINPDSATSPLRKRKLTGALGLLGSSGASLSRRSEPEEWRFGGVIRTKEHHDALQAWYALSHPIHITDHLGRRFEAQLTRLAVTERRPTQNVRWRMRYEMTCLILKEF